MKHCFLALLMPTMLFAAAAAFADTPPMPDPADSTAFRVMTFNIRYNNPGDGQNAWPQRRDWVAEIIRQHQIDLLGAQEAQQNQVADLEERLPEFAWYGVGRDDGRAAGEFTPLFYRKSRFELLDSGAFWLSETPEQPGSKGWDAAITRVAVWGKLRDRLSGRTLFAFNTHFDHRGREARQKSAEFLLRKISEIAGDAPVVLMGDFNCTPNTPPYKILTAEPETPHALRLRDAHAASQSEPQGPTGTWNGFDRVVPGQRIDFIFVTPKLHVLSHAILAQTRDGRFPSDHLPVVATLRW